jgi:hypothetical protein
MTGLDKKLILPDGRKLCHAEYENPDGLPVLYFHGSPSSRLEPGMSGVELQSTGLRIIAPNRLFRLAGTTQFYGLGERYRALTNHPGWPNFALLGNSGSFVDPSRKCPRLFAQGRKNLHMPIYLVRKGLLLPLSKQQANGKRRF